MQMKVLDFMEKEEAATLGKLGGSIQQSHNHLLKLEGDSIWLHTLLANQSHQQFLQARPHPTPISAPRPSQPPLGHSGCAFDIPNLRCPENRDEGRKRSRFEHGQLFHLPHGSGDR